MEALGRLAGGVAHDFNNLLTSIRGLGALVLDEVDASHPIRPDLEEILKAAQRATDLTTELLAFAGRQRLETAVVDVNALVDDAAREARSQHPALRIEVVTDPSVPFVAADAAKLRHAIGNLIASAARVSDGRGPVGLETRHARVTEDTVPGLGAGDYAVVHVSDEGQLTPEQLDAVFEPFAAPRSATKGAGLALAVAYGIVRRAGGLLVAEALTPGVRVSAFVPLATSVPDRRPA
ncbi:MAG TPA: ATP-binding protein [Longimicrobiales bacterium]